MDIEEIRQEILFGHEKEVFMKIMEEHGMSEIETAFLTGLIKLWMQRIQEEYNEKCGEKDE